MLQKPLENISILLVEDNEMNTLLASAILSRSGAGITETDNGKEAVELLKEKSFDVILMDLHLPVMNGFETTRQIRNDLKLNVPVIAITANIINDEEARCLEAGMNAFITKPYTEEELIQKILSCYRKQHITGKTNDAEAPLYNLSTLHQLTRGNQAQISEILKAFSNQTPVLIQQLKEGLQTRNFDAIHSAAHSLKSNIDTLDITTIKAVVRQIETLATEKKGMEELELLIPVLESTLLKVTQQFKAREIT